MKLLFKKMSMMFRLFFTGHIISAIRYKLFILGLRKVLPASIIQGMSIKNKEDKLMIDVQKLFTEKSNILINPGIPTYYVRPIVAEKLSLIAEEIKDEGFTLYIDCLYRDIVEQTRRFKTRLIEVKKEHPSMSEIEVENIAKKFTARPSLFSPHVTGSAVDLCLIETKTGNLLEYGTPIGVMSEKTVFNARTISYQEKDNREFLRNVMERHDFVCYPGEWWHYSYGDQAWAVYRGENAALYGGIEKIINNQNV